MIDSASTIEIALSIRPYIDKLLNAEEAQQMQQSLDSLLQQFQAGQVDESEIWELLTDNRAIRIWISQIELENKEVRRGQDSMLPGYPSSISAPKFKCPQCNYTWSKARAGAITPICPDHHLLLLPIS